MTKLPASIPASLPMSRKQIMSIVESETASTAIWTGAIRSGKTIASIVAFFLAVARAPSNGLILIVGRTLQTIERNIVEPMKDEAIYGAFSRAVHHTRGSSTAIILGRVVHLVGANDVGAEAKIRGLTAYLAMVDEATLIPENFWTQLQGRLSVPGARLLATTNPDNPEHYLKTKFIDRADEPEMDLKVFHFWMDDNPKLEPAYIARKKAEFTGVFYRRFILGDWVAAEGAVFDTYDRDQHVIRWEDLPEMRWILGVGIDHGTTNPTHAVMIGHGVDDVLYCMDEWRYKAGKEEARWSNVELSQGVRTWMAGPHHPDDDPDNPPRARYRTVVDAAAADFRVQLKQDGVSSLKAHKDVLYGIRTMVALISAKRLKFTDRCPELLKEIPSYVWDDKASEEGKDQVVKLNDHGIDAVRYLLVTEERKWRRWIKLGSLPGNRDDPDDELLEAA
ncbi:PBSX family phage terminase large subunit [Nocardia thailandica]|uniref:PBSX family phage terminase large subunit n=1 Tax=Nocardia thailandica TaxID=257275 RepID=UPI0002D995D9|nr:PBSX family phage terminase large subunit [Nocardia thailandica]